MHVKVLARLVHASTNGVTDWPPKHLVMTGGQVAIGSGMAAEKEEQLASRRDLNAWNKNKVVAMEKLGYADASAILHVLTSGDVLEPCGWSTKGVLETKTPKKLLNLCWKIQLMLDLRLDGYLVWHSKELFFSSENCGDCYRPC